MATDRTKTPLQLLVEGRAERELEAMLRELFLEKHASDAEIAEAIERKTEIRVSRVTVKLWRDQFGITPEDRPAVSI